MTAEEPGLPTRSDQNPTLKNYTAGGTALQTGMPVFRSAPPAKMVVATGQRGCRSTAGLKMAVQALGGRYAEIRAGRPTGLNPLATESGERGEAWLLDWLVALLESRSGPMAPLQSEALKSAIAQNDTIA